MRGSCREIWGGLRGLRDAQWRIIMPHLCWALAPGWSGAQWWICKQFLGLHGAFLYLPQGSERKGWWAEAQPTNMSLLCFPSLATAVTSWSLPVLMMPTWGLSLGTDFCAGFSPTPFPSSCLMTNTDSPFPASHSFAFYQEGDNECTAIDFQGISAPRDRESIIWIRNTFLSPH